MSVGAILTTTVVKSKAIKARKPFVRGRHVCRILNVFIIVTPKTVVDEQVASLSLYLSLYILLHHRRTVAYTLFSVPRYVIISNPPPTRVLPHRREHNHSEVYGPARSVVVIVDFFVTARFRSFQSRGILDITRRCVT